MQPKILKFWHQWSWVFHIGWALIIAAVYFTSFQNSAAANTTAIVQMKKEHDDENMKTRMAVQENTTQEINNRLASIEQVQGKIFERINQIADRGTH